MADRKRTLIFAQIAMLFPSLLFMIAVALQMTHAIRPAEQIVAWYAARMWTLWLLLIALPLAVLASGASTLLRFQRAPSDSRSTLPLFRATTGTAAVILAIVAVHMAAN